MAQTMPEVFDLHAPLHEFLPVGVTPADPDLIPVRTPWKLTYGPCTLAVTTLASISPGWVPEEVGPRCVDPHGYSAWFSIHDGAKAVLNHCLTEQKAGMSWTLKHEPHIGIFLIARGSSLDMAIGPKVNGVLHMPPRLDVMGSNLTSVGGTVS